MALLLVLHFFFNIEIRFVANKPITIFIVGFSHNLGVLYTRPLAVTDFFRVYLRILQVLCELLLVNLGFCLIDSLFDDGCDTEALVGVCGAEVEPEITDHSLGALLLCLKTKSRNVTHLPFNGLTYIGCTFEALHLSFGCHGPLLPQQSCST